MCGHTVFIFILAVGPSLFGHAQDVLCKKRAEVITPAFPLLRRVNDLAHPY